MKDLLQDYDKCHKCGGQGIYLGSQEVGYTRNGYVQIEHDYECEGGPCGTCRATWDVQFELTPIERDNHDD